MRNSTPKSKAPDVEITKSIEKTTSGKKLKQCRLPFKIIAPSPSPSVQEGGIGLPKAKETPSGVRKRRLSYKSEDEKSDSDSARKIQSKENEEASLSSKEKPNVDDDVIVLDDTDNALNNSADTTHTSKINNGDVVSRSSSSAKVMVKLSFNKSSKRRKSMRKSAQCSTEHGESLSHNESADDVELSGNELNLVKRPRVEKPKHTVLKEQEEAIEIIELNDRDEDANKNEQSKLPKKITKSLKRRLSNETKKRKGLEEAPINGAEEKPSVKETPLTPIDKETVDETQRKRVMANEPGGSKAEGKSHTTTKPSKKEEREMIRKLERGKREELRNKEREEREELRRKEREENERRREEQRNKEREEREELKRKEREEKERKRQVEIDAKNEERRKRYEAKEEERRRKDQEKEEAALKKKKAADGFKKFFVAKEARCSLSHDQRQMLNESGSEQGLLALAFRPFQLRGDMQLAPVCRKTLTTAAKLLLDNTVSAEHNKLSPRKKNGLYLSELTAGRIKPWKWRKSSVSSKANEENDDVYIIGEVEPDVGQAIEETHAPVEHVRAKFYKFEENRRPPYYGTWRKRTAIISARRPFAQDKQFLDYEVDSDLEWEEEEPGESLDGSDDEKEKESEDDDYEVDNECFVPHGHLSDEELQNEDECGNDSNDREAQKVKLKLQQQVFAQEMKKKTEKLKPRLIGCIWVDENGNQAEKCPKIIWDMLNKHAMLYTTAPQVSEPEKPTERTELSSPSTNAAERLKPIILSTAMLRDLIRLVHGNSNSKSFLIKEFIAYVETNELAIKNGQVRGPLKSMVREKIDEFAEWKGLDTNDISSSRRKNKSKYKKRLCWVVADNILNEMELESLTLVNQWQYILQPKSKGGVTEKEPTTEATSAASLIDETDAAGNDECNEKKSTSHEKVLESNINAVVPAPAEKKRVALLMSVPRGEQFPTTAKNVLISQFLTKTSEEAKNKVRQTPAGVVEVLD